MLKGKKLLIIVGIILLIIIIVTSVLLILKPSNKKEVSQNVRIKHNVVDKLYEEIKYSSNDKEYVSKLYGYTYDENKNIIVNTKEGYIENGKLYDLDGKEIGNYNKETLNEDLEKATLKTYNYKNDNGKYTLKR